MRQDIFDRLMEMKGDKIEVNGKRGTLNDFWENGPDKIRLELYTDNDGIDETDIPTNTLPNIG